MASNSSQNVSIRKRRYSQCEYKPVKRTKRLSSLGPLSDQEIEPNVEEWHHLHNENCIVNKTKTEINELLVKNLLKLVSESGEVINHFITTFKKTGSTKKVIKSGFSFLKDLIQNIVKNLAVCTCNLVAMENAFDSSIISSFTDVTNKARKFNLSLRKEFDSENTEDDLILLSNMCQKSNPKEFAMNASKAVGNRNEAENIIIDRETIPDVTNPHTISEEDENDDAHSVHSYSSQKTLLNVILKEDTTITTKNIDDFERFRLCQRNGSYTDSEVDLDISDTMSDTDSYVFDISEISTPTNAYEDNDGDEITDVFHETDPSEGVYDELHSETLPHITNTTGNNGVNSRINSLNHVDYDVQADHTNLSVEEEERKIASLHTEVKDIDKETLEQEVALEETLDEQNYEIQSEFLHYFGLKGNFIEGMECENIDDDDDIYDSNAALNILKAGKDELLNLSGSLSSLSDSYASDASDDETVPEGRIINRLPSLPHTSESEAEENSRPGTTNTATIDLKECRIILQKVDENCIDSTLKTPKWNDEEREINRLTNLAFLETVRNGTGSSTTKSSKVKLSTKPSAVSEDNDIDEDTESVDISISGNISVIEPEDFAMELNKICLKTLWNEGEEEEMEEEHNDDDKNQKKKERKLNDSDKENKQKGSTINKELTAEELAKRKWRNDKLLKEKLSDLDTDSESEEDAKTNMLLKKLKNKCQTTDSDTDSDSNFKNNQIVIESDFYDSEIEFVSEIKKTRIENNGVSKTRGAVEVSDSDYDSDSSYNSDSVIEESRSAKKGRKNIRAILSDETLEEATKKAVITENKRKERLTQKQKAVDSFLSQTSLDNESAGLVLDVDDANENPLVVVHHKLTKRLKLHQEQGVRFMWESCYEGVKQLNKDKGSGCILAHCMGLGKTFQVVTLVHTLFAHQITNVKHVLVVCPLSIVLNWNTEFKTGLQNLNEDVKINIFLISENFRTPEQRLACVFKWRRRTGVLVMGYEAFQRLTTPKNCEKLNSEEIQIRKALVDPGPDLVILDEGHLLKNGKINRTQSLMQIKTKRRIVLTGTPLQNNLKEYYYMVQFVKPNLLGSYHEYANRFINPITNGQFDDSTHEDIEKMKMRSHVLHKMLKDTIQRYEVSELRNYLPPRYDYAVFIQLHTVQMQLYNKYIEIANKVEKMKLFRDYHVLQCISTHPYLLFLKKLKKMQFKKKTKEVDVIKLDVDPDAFEMDTDQSIPDDWWTSIYPKDCTTKVEYGPKFNVMMSIIRESEKIGDKVLIFTNSLIELDAIEHYLQQNQTETSKWKPREDYYRMDGAVLPETRLQLCNSFNNRRNKRTRVFIISHKVGGLGLNLIAANRVILMDVNWNPAVDNQSVFRSYRFGQVKQCYVYRLVAMGTMEQVVYDRQVTKSAIARRVVDEKQISRRYKKEELEDMYRVKFHLYNEKRDPHILPEDTILKRILNHHKDIFKYHEHNALLENRPDEQLDENQMKLAWEEYNREQEKNVLDQQKKKITLANAAAILGLNPAVTVSSSATATNVTATVPNADTVAPSTNGISSLLQSEPTLSKTGSTSNNSKSSSSSQSNPGGIMRQVLPETTSTVTISSSTKQLPTQTGMELRQKFSEWVYGANKPMVIPKIVSVVGAQPGPLNRSSSSLPSLTSCSTPARISSHFHTKSVAQGNRLGEPFQTNSRNSTGNRHLTSSIKPFIPFQHRSASGSSTILPSFSNAGNSSETNPKKNLGYNITPDQLRVATSNSSQNVRSRNVVSNVFNERNISNAVRKNKIGKSTNQQSNQNKEIIEIDDSENQAKTTTIKKHHDLITSLQSNLNITLSSVGNHNNNSQNRRRNMPLRPTSNQKTSTDVSGIIEID